MFRNRVIMTGCLNHAKRDLIKNGEIVGSTSYIRIKTYSNYPIAFFGEAFNQFKLHYDEIKDKLISIRGSLRKKNYSKFGQNLIYVQIRIEDFCLGSVDLYKEPAKGFVYQATQSTGDVEEVLEEMFGEEEYDEEKNNKKIGGIAYGDTNDLSRLADNEAV